MTAATLPETPVSSRVPLTDSDSLYEIVNGERVELPPMSILSVFLTMRLGNLMYLFAGKHGLGTVVSEALFIFDGPNRRGRRPDIAFVSKERWPLDKPMPDVGDWEVVPDLAVEVNSPNDTFAEVHKKLGEYFKYGVRQVWVVMPREKEVLIYTAPSEYRILTIADTLDGGEIIPGFRLTLAELFKQPAASDSTPR